MATIHIRLEQADRNYQLALMCASFGKADMLTDPGNSVVGKVFGKGSVKKVSRQWTKEDEDSRREWLEAEGLKLPGE